MSFERKLEKNHLSRFKIIQRKYRSLCTLGNVDYIGNIHFGNNKYCKYTGR